MFNFSNNAKKKKRKKKKRQCNLLETEVHLDSGKHRVYRLRVWKKKKKKRSEGLGKETCKVRREGVEKKKISGQNKKKKMLP